MKIALYYNTIRYLRLRQIIWRIWYRIYRPKLKYGNIPNCRQTVLTRVNAVAHRQTLISEDYFYFLNKFIYVKNKEDWNEPNLEKLYRYNLHYFDDLNAEKSTERYEWHICLISKWISENQPGHGIGWESYPLSIRIVNWIKWAMSQPKLPDYFHESLVLQGRCLYNKIEHHILGNHLIANAKALIFLGCFYQGHEPELWIEKGARILQEELQEQILADGGHFERSPMYHSIILEDILDLYNIYNCYPEAFYFLNYNLKQVLEAVAKQMLIWLKAIVHPDGDIPLLNDAAFNVAGNPQELIEYAYRLGIAVEKDSRSLIYLSDSGYIVVRSELMQIIVDVGRLGPDYQIGHGHCDTLSYELSFNGHRLITDTGVYSYQNKDMRDYCRSTSAHNTLKIDGYEQSEIWDLFRVARRAYPQGIEIKQNSDTVEISCEHTGYQRLKTPCQHIRQWIVNRDTVQIIDKVVGKGKHFIESYMHFAPEVKVNILSNECIIFEHKDSFGTMKFKGVDRLELINTYYCPEFGKKIQRSTIVMKLGITDNATIFLELLLGRKECGDL